MGFIAGRRKRDLLVSDNSGLIFGVELGALGPNRPIQVRDRVHVDNGLFLRPLRATVILSLRQK